MGKSLIIIVDDEKMVLDSLRSQLNRHFGSNVTYELAESGEEALEILEEIVPSHYSVILIISDWLMPNMKGDEFLLKAHDRYPGVRKIMLTGHAEAYVIGKLASKIDGFRVIHKPWDEKKLVGEIKADLNV